MPIQKVLKSTPIWSSLWLQILPNPSQRYDSSSEILRFVNIIHDILSETFSIFLPKPPCMISWDLDKSHDFQTSFVFFRILKPFGHTVRGRVFWTRCSKFLFISLVRPHTRLNNMNIIFLIILFYYLNHLQFKFDLYQKIPWNSIN